MGIYSAQTDQYCGAIVNFEELPLPQRIIRDLASEKTAKISVDSREIHGKLQEFVEEFVPNIKERLIHYPGERPILICIMLKKTFKEHCRRVLR